MTPAADVGECVERLVHGFTTYDRAVDVVSAFEMAFTSSRTGVPGTVLHFERFARIADETGNALTPDFSLVFTDGGGLVGRLRDKYGGVRSRDVERALELLKTAKLAERTTDGWVVAWEELRVTGDRDLAHALATRSCRPPGRSALAKLEAAERAAATAPEPPPKLF